MIENAIFVALSFNPLEDEDIILFQSHKYLFSFVVTCHIMDQCLKQSYNDDFDWSFGINCTKTPGTGPCSDHVLSSEGMCSISLSYKL